jgi:hypothetical protein
VASFIQLTVQHRRQREHVERVCAGRCPYHSGRVRATFFVTSETDTLVGHGTPQVVDSPSENFDTGVPAVPGHYSIAQQLFGFTGPGVTAQMQVVKIPGT